MISPDYQNEEALNKKVEGQHCAGLLTINNPGLHCDWCDLAPTDATTTAEYSKQCENAIKHYFRKSNSKNKLVNEKDNGAIAVWELGESGNHHIHMLVCHRRKTNFERIKEKFPSAHIDLVYGTLQEAKDYIHKQGRYDEKKPTQKCEAISGGNYFDDNNAKTLTMMEQIELMLADGFRPEDIYAISPKFAYYRNAIDNCYYARAERDIPINREVFVEWHIGESGSGKSYSVDDLSRSGLIEQIYEVDFENNKFAFDNYDPGKHKILVIDDIRPGLIPPTFLLKLLDNRRLDLAARYKNRKAGGTKVICTSVLGPEEVFKAKGENDSEKQILRRIDKYVYHIIDERYPELNDPKRYKTFEMESKDYENCSQLQKVAMNDFLDKVQNGIYK